MGKIDLPSEWMQSDCKSECQCSQDLGSVEVTKGLTCLLQGIVAVRMILIWSLVLYLRNWKSCQCLPVNADCCLAQFLSFMAYLPSWYGKDPGSNANHQVVFGNREAFDLFDTDGSGTIDAKELKVAMR